MDGIKRLVSKCFFFRMRYRHKHGFHKNGFHKKVWIKIVFIFLEDSSILRNSLCRDRKITKDAPAETGKIIIQNYPHHETYKINRPKNKNFCVEKIVLIYILLVRM